MITVFVIPALAGITAIVLERNGLLKQLLFALTFIFPPTDPAVALILDVVELPLQPDGIVQVYVVAPGSAVILYMCVEPSPTVDGPEIADGWFNSGSTSTALYRLTLTPQLLSAVTHNAPVNPAEVEIDVDVEFPLQPAGNPHV